MTTVPVFREELVKHFEGAGNIVILVAVDIANQFNEASPLPRWNI